MSAAATLREVKFPQKGQISTETITTVMHNFELASRMPQNEGF